LIVGITGGIGSGKTVVSQILDVLGVPVFNSDIQAKNILQNNSEVKDKIIAEFGDDSFFNDIPNRSFIAEKVFTNPENLKFLNSIIHPAVQNEFEEWLLKHKNHNIVFKEAAILIESGAYEKLDKLILVEADLETRIERVMKRDHVNSEQVLHRIQNQMNDEEKRKYADFIIDNSGDKSVIKQLILILKELGEDI
jgi:dephospho-CoA kinase